MKICDLLSEEIVKNGTKNYFPQYEFGSEKISIGRFEKSKNAFGKIYAVQTTKENCMTDKQALKKAVKLFGKQAWIEKGNMCSREEFIKRNPHSNPDFWNKFWGHKRHVVGVCSYGILREIKGQGITWEDAFLNVKP